MGATRRHLFVDGYNILHGWRWLDRATRRSSDADAACARLVEAVAVLHDAEAMEVTVVFDGKEIRTIQSPAAPTGVDVLFARAGLTADGAIERAIATAPAPASCLVATDDRLLGETVRASGGDALSAEQLAAWIERCRKRSVEAAGRRVASQAKSFANKLPL